MTDSQSSQSQPVQFGKTFEIVTRLVLAFLLVGLCFQVFLPFALPTAWAVIIAVGSYPGYQRIRSAVGGRDKVAAPLFVVLAFAVILVPSVLLAETLIGSAREIAGQLEGSAIVVPPPPASISGWPIVGQPLFEFWTLASNNLATALKQLGPQLASAAGVLLGAAAEVGLMIIQFIVASLIAGVLLANADACRRSAVAIANRLVGERGREYAELSGATVRNVARGILGVAVIQSLMAGIGFLVIGLPAAGLWALLCLILAIIQLGPGLVVIPAVIYVFSTGETLPAVLFLIWNIVVLVSDNILKPMLMGRGSRVPVVVIFIGALGGFMTMGIIGLFVGSIILSLGYELFRTWLGAGEETVPSEAVESV
jgi:predicted PurR-regulated permease PerM